MSFSLPDRKTAVPIIQPIRCIKCFLKTTRRTPGSNYSRFELVLGTAPRLQPVTTILFIILEQPQRIVTDQIVKLAYVPEIAAMISAHSRLLIENPNPFSTTLLGDFFIHSRNRFNRWLKDLNDLQDGLEIRNPLHLAGLSPARPPIQSITEQILMTDLLNHVWTVAAVSSDRYRGEDRLQNLIRNVFRGHLTIRARALTICMRHESLTSDQMSQINKLRCSVQRWSDFLCSTLMGRFELWEYSYDKTCAQEFCRERCNEETVKTRSQVWTMILAGLRHSFRDEDGLGAPLHEDDRQITRTIFKTFPAGDPNMAIWTDTAFVAVEQ